MRRGWCFVVSLLVVVVGASFSEAREESRLSDSTDFVCDDRPENDVVRAVCAKVKRAPGESVLVWQVEKNGDAVFLAERSEVPPDPKGYRRTTATFVCVSLKGVVRTCTRERIQGAKGMGLRDELEILRSWVFSDSREIVLRLVCEAHGIWLGEPYDVRLEYSEGVRRWKVVENEFRDQRRHCPGRNPFGF